MKDKVKLFALLFIFACFFLYHSKSEHLDKVQPNLWAFRTSDDTTVIEEEASDSLTQDEVWDWDEIYRIYEQLKGEKEDSLRDEYYFQIQKSFDIFAAAFRELLKNYVIEIPPLELIEYALDGITRQLDPYTNFFLNEKELNDVVSNYEYVGLGIVVNEIDSSLVVVDFIDSLAKDISGLKFGDQVEFIDNVKLVPNLDTLRAYTSGKVNSRIELRVRREGVDTLIPIVTFRRKIEFPEVSFSKIFDVDDGKAIYISIGQFSPNMPDVVRELLRSFVKFKPEERKGIIIDLRDNPGGTLESAIQLCEMFLPPNTIIVSTRGRAEDEEKTYKATIAPIDTTTPLIVLVNNGSASASEIVAAAIQDNDRGVILGEKTFGKGIIQSIAVLPYDSYLKITTAKYFSPSGRSIHKNIYLSSASKQIGKLYSTDTLFYTKNGRVVRESNGIQPDIEIKEKDRNSFVDFIRSKALIVKFITRIENQEPLSLGILQNKKRILEKFSNYLKEKGIDYKPFTETLLDTMIAYLERDKTQGSLLQKFKGLKKEMHKPIDKLVQENSNEILEEIENEIERRIVSFYEYKYYVLQQDEYFKESVTLLKNPKRYYEILGVKK